MYKTNCFALIRGKSRVYVDTALRDLLRHAHLTFAGTPRVCDPAFADNILVNVIKGPLKEECISAAVVELEDGPARAIYYVQKIHAPAHVVIVSPTHEIYGSLLEKVGQMPVLDFTMPGEEEDLYGN